VEAKVREVIGEPLPWTGKRYLSRRQSKPFCRQTVTDRCKEKASYRFDGRLFNADAVLVVGRDGLEPSTNGI
jgi:hypothetical protein